jgi:hypothetical protein
MFSAFKIILTKLDFLISGKVCDSIFISCWASCISSALLIKMKIAIFNSVNAVKLASVEMIHTKAEGLGVLD